MNVVDAYRRLDRRFMAIAAPWVYLLVPGIAIHELAHVGVGRRYGDVEVDWTRPHVAIEWDESVPVWGVFGFFLAPLLVGGLAAFAVPAALAIAPTTVDIWLVLNWFLLAGPSFVDVRSLILVLSGA